MGLSVREHGRPAGRATFYLHTGGDVYWPRRLGRQGRYVDLSVSHMHLSTFRNHALSRLRVEETRGEASRRVYNLFDQLQQGSSSAWTSRRQKPKTDQANGEDFRLDVE